MSLLSDLSDAFENVDILPIFAIFQLTFFIFPYKFIIYPYIKGKQKFHDK